MPGINPQNREGQEKLSPEKLEALRLFRAQQEQQKHAGELLDAVQGPEVKHGIPFDPGYPDDKLAQETAKVVPFKKPEAAGSDETGLDAVEAEKLRRDPTSWVNEAIGRKDLDPNDAMLGLIEASEQEEQDKAA